MRRPIPGLAKQAPEFARHMTWMDNLCLDSEYDYDPVWAKCVELGIAPTFHSFGLNWGMRTSISSFMYNQIGHFAAAAEGICKALFLGGVTRRFPDAQVRFQRGRRRLGGESLLRAVRALAQAQSPDAGSG